MPTYDYQCRSCGTVTEVIHAMTEDGPTVCERCGGELRRVLYPAGIIFKGSGFYRTDSRSSGGTATPKEKPAGSDGAAPSSKPADTGGSGTTKPASSTKGDSSG